MGVGLWRGKGRAGSNCEAAGAGGGSTVGTAVHAVVCSAAGCTACMLCISCL